LSGGRGGGIEDVKIPGKKRRNRTSFKINLTVVLQVQVKKKQSRKKRGRDAKEKTDFGNQEN